jgi:MFS family permease
MVSSPAQAIGSSSVLSVGAGSIGDIYRPTERGRAMGVYYAGALIGPALAPVVAGVLTQYTHGAAGGWRAMQWLLACMGVLSFVFTIIALPETIHKRGIDKILEDRRLRNGDTSGPSKKFTWVWLDPSRSLRLLKHYNILAIVSIFFVEPCSCANKLQSFNSSLVLLTTYCEHWRFSETRVPHVLILSDRSHCPSNVHSWPSLRYY